MKTKTEKKVKPLKKIKALEKQNEIEAQMVKPAVRIQELKNKLIILGHELKVNKKIIDSLYRKIQLLTYSRTTEQKLKDSYKTLKDIENKIINKTATTEKTKKITEDEKPLNYINPYDEMIKNDEKMIEQYINQYEYDIDYEFDINSVDDIKDEMIKKEIVALYQ